MQRNFDVWKDDISTLNRHGYASLFKYRTSAVTLVNNMFTRSKADFVAIKHTSALFPISAFIKVVLARTYLGTTHVPTSCTRVSEW